MRQAQFEQLHGPLWEQVEALLSARRSEEQARLPELYRRLCQCLALAEQRGYAPALTGYLRSLALRCHRQLYGASAARPLALASLFFQLPRTVRAHWRLLLAVLVLFYGTALAAGVFVWLDPQRAFLFESPMDLERMHKMYSPSSVRVGRGGAEGDVLMFGFYIWNNVSIGFRTFAGGVAGGLPALFSVGLNALSLGVTGAWLSLDPATRTSFWSFVVTHASFEITGLLLSAMAGMHVGWAVLRPGRLTRRRALQEAARTMFPVVAGAAALTVLAASFEAFWSARTAIPPEVKFTVGGICWLLVILYFGLAGRTPRGRDDAA